MTRVAELGPLRAGFAAEFDERFGERAFVEQYVRILRQRNHVVAG